MTRRVRRVALTGGLASGKSHCLAAFARLGAPTIDADALAHAALAPGTAGLAAVVRRFGDGVLMPDGALDRRAVAAQMFADLEMRRALEDIVHPIVYQEIERWFHALGDRLGIAEIPLIYESGHDAEFDYIIVAACPPDQQIARAISRGLTQADARARLAAQWPIDEKRRRADAVIDTSGTFTETDQQVEEIWRRVTGSP